jgi:hypothetical protein
MKKLVVAIVALAIFAGVGLLTASQLGDNALRLAEAERDVCYASQGYFVRSGQTIPDEVRNQCTQPIRTYEDGVTMRLVYGGLAGLAVAAIFLVLAWFLMFRRRQPEGAPPPAG